MPSVLLERGESLRGKTRILSLAAALGLAIATGSNVTGAAQQRTAAIAASQTKDTDKCIPAWNTFVGHTKLSASILSSARASDGFIYLGGGDGLYRVEGGRVRDFRPDYYDRSALPAGRIADLLDDGTHLWIATGAGLARTVPGSDRFERIGLPGAVGRIEVRTLARSAGGLMIGTDQGAFLHSNQGVRKLALPSDGKGKSIVINSIIVRGTRTILGTSQGLFEADEGGKVRALASPLGEANVIELRLAPDGRLWGLTVDTLFGELIGGTAEWVVRPQAATPGMPRDVLTTLEFDPGGRLWVASRNGLSRARDPAGTFVNCRRAINGSDADSDMGVVHLSFSLGPYVFAGTSGQGATHAPMTDAVRIVVPGVPQNRGLPPDSPWNAHKLPDGRLLIGMAAGLFAETAPGSDDFRPVAPGVLGERLIYAALVDGERIWAGTDRGLFLVGPDGSAREVPLLETGSAGTAMPIFALKRHRDEVLVGAFGGLFVLDGESAAARLYFRSDRTNLPRGNPKVVDIVGSRIWSMDPSDSRLLAAGDAFVFMLDLESGEVLASTETASKEGQFVAGRVYAALREDANRILIGTESGFVVSDESFTRFEPVRKINALTLEAVPVLGRAPDGQIWLGVAGNGLFHKRPGSNGWARVGHDEGLATNGVGQLGLSFASDGSVLITNGSGISIISPALSQLPASVDLPNVSVFEVLSGKALTPSQRSLVVPPEARNLKLQFALPAILESGEYLVEYSFTREGEPSVRREIALGDDLNLLEPAAGTYTLAGRVVSASGQASRPFSYVIDIRPRWWERPAVYVVLFVFLAALGVWAFRLLERAKQRRIELLSAEHRRIAQSLHDSTLQDIFGALLLSRSLDGRNSDNQPDDKGERIAQLLSSATTSLRRSIDINGSREEIKALSAAIRDFRPPASLAQPVTIEFAEEGRVWPMGTHRAFCILQIVTEAINNAAKHADATTIMVRMHWSLLALSITLSDDGKGFDPAAPDTAGGFGLPGMHRMAEVASVRLTIDSQQGTGTQVHLLARRFVF